MILRYEIILYWSEENQAFIAEVPELPGCAADGKTYQEALQNVEVIMQEWIETAKELGRPIPEPKGRLMFAQLIKTEVRSRFCIGGCIRLCLLQPEIALLYCRCDRVYLVPRCDRLFDVSGWDGVSLLQGAIAFPYYVCDRVYLPSSAMLLSFPTCDRVFVWVEAIRGARQLRFTRLIFLNVRSHLSSPKVRSANAPLMLLKSLPLTLVPRYRFASR